MRKGNRFSTLFIVFIALVLCLSAAGDAYVEFTAPATSMGTVTLCDNENLPFEITVIDNDDSTATLVCDVNADIKYELMIGKEETEENYQLITDDTFFVVDLNDEYSVCFKIIYEGIIYYYGGYISVTKNDDVAVVQKRGFFLNTVEEFEDLSESLNVDFSDIIHQPLQAMSEEAPGAATISSPTSGKTYTINSSQSYSYSSTNATKYHTAVKIISGTPYPESNNEAGKLLLENLNTVNKTTYFNILNDSNYAGQWVKLYVRGGDSTGYGSTAIRYVQIKPLTPTLNNPTQSNGKVSLSWSATAGAVSYNVYRSTSASGTYSMIGNTTSRSYENTPGTGTFYYKVAAVAKTTSSTYAGILSKGVIGDQSAYKSITVSSTTPVWSLSRSYITFPAASVGYSNSQMAVSTTINNTGTVALTSVSASITAGSAYFEISSSPSSSIAAKGSSTVSVRPKAKLPKGNYSGVLTVYTGNGGSKSVNPLSFTVNDTTPVWSLSRSYITFPAASVGYSNSQMAVSTTISNSGTVALTSVSASITAGSAYFEISSSPSSSIAAKGSSTVSVRPKTKLPKGNYSGVLTVYTGNGGNKSVSPLSFTVNDATPGAANILSPSANGTTYTINSNPSYSYSSTNATKFHTAVKIITGLPDPNNTSEAGTLLFENSNTTSTTTKLAIPNNSSHAGQWVKLYVRGGNSSNQYGSPAIKYVQIKPLTPTLNNPTQSNGKVSLSWSATAGAASYNVYRSTSASGAYSMIGNTTSRSYENTPGTGTFYYKVAAVAKTTSSAYAGILSKGVVGDQSAYKSITVSPTTPVWSLSRSYITFPAASVGYSNSQMAVSTTISNTGTVALTSVSASITAGSAYFEISSSPSSSIAAKGASTVSVRPKTKLPKGNYSGVLTVYTGNGGNKSVSPLSFTVNDAVPGAANISSPSANGTTYTINSNPSYSYSSTNATKYNTIVKIITGTPNPSSDNENGDKVFDTITLNKQISFPIPNNSSHAGRWAKLYVQGINNANVGGIPAVKYVQIKPLTPTLSSLTQTNGTVSLSWSAAAGAASYNVYRSTSASVSYSLIGNTKSRSYSDTPGAGIFYYKVAAVAQTTTLTDSRILSSGVVGDQSTYIRITTTPPNKYTVTLDRQGAYLGSTNFVATLNSPSLDGYTPPMRSYFNFSGYWTAATGGSAVITTANAYAANVSGYTNANRQWIKTTTPTTLYARWTQTVNLNRQGGTTGATSFTATYGSATFTNYTRPTHPNGFTFDGYWTAPSGGYRVITATGAYEVNASGYTNASRQWIWTSAPPTLHARWTPEVNNKYTVTYNPNGGTGSVITVRDVEPNRYYIVKDQNFYLNDYTFVGWNTQADGLGANYSTKHPASNPNNQIFMTSSITLYAQWRRNVVTPYYSYDSYIYEGAYLYIIRTHANNIGLADLEKKTNLSASGHYGINGGFYNRSARDLLNDFGLVNPGTLNQDILNIAIMDGKPVGPTNAGNSADGNKLDGSSNTTGDGVIYYNGANTTGFKDETLTTNKIPTVLIGDKAWTGSWAQGGIPMYLGETNWVRGTTGWIIQNKRDISDPNIGRTALVVDTRSNYVYLIVKYDILVAIPEPLFTLEQFRNAIADYIKVKLNNNVSIGMNTSYKGIFLDGGGSSQLRCRETSIRGDARKLKQIIYLKNK